MKVLWVDACVRNESRTRKLCEYYINQFSKRESIELKHIQIAQMGLRPFDEKMIEKRANDIATDHLEGMEYTCAYEFAEADWVVIGAPYWDCSFPAILKIYFEHLFVNRITFEYSEEGRPVGLCNAKKLIYITTSGGYVGQYDSGEKYLRDVCEMFGIKEIDIIRAEGLDIKDADIDEIMRQAKSKIDRQIGQKVL